MKRTKKKLPRYWLGTRIPTSLGYQPNYGIGNVLYTTTPGYSIAPETRAVKANTIPNVLNKAQTYGSFLTESLKNVTTIGGNAAMANFGKSAISSVGGTANMPADALNTIKNINKIGAGTKVLNAAGTAMAAIGSAYGLYDMGTQIAANKDSRSAGEMRNTLATNTYTTDLGNTYTTHSGVNAGAELDYSRALRKSRNLSFTASSIGTGASLGTLIGSAVGAGATGGSVAPGVGTAIGAGVGLLGGLLAYGLGFGDTEAETRRLMGLLSDAVAMEDRLSESAALDKDVKQGFYGRINSGNIASAAFGKDPYGKMSGNGHGDKIEMLQGANGPHLGVAKSMVKNKEVVYNFKTKNGDLFIGPEGGDVIPSDVEPNDPNAIYSEDLKIGNRSIADIAKPIVEHLNKLKQIAENAGGSERQKLFQRDMVKRAMDKNDQELLKLSEVLDMIRSSKNTAKYKCGKMPKYEKGTPFDYAAIATPNIAQMIAAWKQYNDDMHMPVEVPKIQANYSAARNAAYNRLGLTPDTRPAFSMMDDLINRYLYNIRRQPIYGPGGRAVLEDSAIRSGIAEKGKLAYLAQLDDIANKNATYKDIATIESHAADVDNSNIIANLGMTLQARAAKYNAIAQDRKNLVTPLGPLFKDLQDVRKYHEAKDLKERMVKLYENQLGIDKAYLDEWLKDRNKDQNIVSSASPEYLYRIFPEDPIKYFNPTSRIFNFLSPYPWIKPGQMYNDFLMYNLQPLYFKSK